MPLGSQGVVCGIFQAWQQASLPTEPFHQPGLLFGRALEGRAQALSPESFPIERWAKITFSVTQFLPACGDADGI